MNPRTQPYRNQHAELSRLAAAIPVDPERLESGRAARALAGLKGVLIVHLQLQEGMLYPWMMRQASFALHEVATAHRIAMRSLLVTFLEFYARWSHEDNIAADREAFVADWRCVLAVLRHRLNGEASDLYRAIEEYAAAPAPALAS